MAPFRPTNINKRSYPGNASVVGPTRQATLGISTTTCFSSTNVCSACASYPLNLGCRCSFCACPCCDICCSCEETLCTRTVPTGRWKLTEQLEAKKRDAWGTNSCDCNAPTCLCCTNIGITAIGNLTDCKGFFICCGPSTCKWFVAPSCTEVSRTWYTSSDAVTVANSCMGSCGWFVPSIGGLQNPGYSCRTYWDTTSATWYWSTSANYFYAGSAVNFATGVTCTRFGKTTPTCVRTIRCTLT